jgi:hypothetical protein
MIEELCISGGSQKGLSYVGALKYLEEIKIIDFKKLKKLIGVSIGSYIASSVLIGYTLDELLEHVMDTDIPSFMDISVKNSGVAILKGEKIRKWVHETIEKKCNVDITMLELYNMTGIEFIVATTCLEDGIVYIDYKNRPNMKLRDVIICSINVPFVFPPYIVKDENGIDKTYIDGGLIDNFPMHLLGHRAIGITSEKNKKTDIGDHIFSYIKSLYDIMKHHIEDLKPHKSEFVYVLRSKDKSTINLNINRDQKITLFMNGYNDTKNSEITKKLLKEIEIRNSFSKVLEEIAKKLKD